MSNQDRLNLYIRQLHQRLRLGVSLRGVAILTATALVTTIFLVLILNAFAFPVRGLTGARIAAAARPCAWLRPSALRFPCGVLRVDGPRRWPNPPILNFSSGCSPSMTGKSEETILSSNCWRPTRFP